MLSKPLQMAQEIVKSTVKTGETVVDATLGNGHDALFLALLVGEDGQVFGFDVQQAAVEASNQKLLGAGVRESVFQFHCKGHQHFEEVVHGEVAAVMFNLGYLPQADKAVITTAETTLPALVLSLESLRLHGVVTIMCYPGHDGGDVEAQRVLEWTRELPRENYRVFQYGMVNAPNAPAFLLAVEKV